MSIPAGMKVAQLEQAEIVLIVIEEMTGKIKPEGVDTTDFVLAVVANDKDDQDMFDRIADRIIGYLIKAIGGQVVHKGTREEFNQ